MLALCDVAVTVKDAKASANWWERTLGFEQHTVGGPGGHALLVAPPGDRFILHLCEGFAPVEPGNSGIAFLTDDFDGTVRRLKTAGVPFPEPVARRAGGGMAKFADPDGNIFWVVGAPKEFVERETRRRARIVPKKAVRTRNSAAGSRRRR